MVHLKGITAIYAKIAIKGIMTVSLILVFNLALPAQRANPYLSDILYHILTHENEKLSVKGVFNSLPPA